MSDDDARDIVMEAGFQEKDQDFILVFYDTTESGQGQYQIGSKKTKQNKKMKSRGAMQYALIDLAKDPKLNAS